MQPLTILPEYQPFYWDYQTKVQHVGSVLDVLGEFYTEPHLYKLKDRQLTRVNQISDAVERYKHKDLTLEQAARLILIDHTLEI